MRCHHCRYPGHRHYHQRELIFFAAQPPGALSHRQRRVLRSGVTLPRVYSQAPLAEKLLLLWLKELARWPRKLSPQCHL